MRPVISLRLLAVIVQRNAAASDYLQSCVYWARWEQGECPPVPDQCCPLVAAAIRQFVCCRYLIGRGN